MRAKLWTLAVAAFAAGLAGVASAQQVQAGGPGNAQPPAPATAPAAVAVGPVAPFLDNQVIAVGRIDLTRIDTAAVFDWAKALAKEVNAGQGPEEEKEAAAALDKLKAEADEALAAFRKAGGRELYILVNPLELAADMPPALVVSVGEGGDPHALETLLTGGGNQNPNQNPNQKPAGQPRPAPPAITAEKLGSVIVAGTPEQLRRLREATQAGPAGKAGGQAGQGQQVERQEVAQAFAAGGDAPIQWVLAPAPDTRRAIQEMLPRLPAEVGGGPSTVVTEGVQWASLAVRPPPQPSVRLVIQSKDAKSAEALAAVVQQMLGAAGRAMVGHAPQGAGGGGAGLQNVLAVGTLVAALTPKVEGDKLVLSLDEPAIRRLSVALFRGPVGQARVAAKRAQSANNIRQLVLACLMWANDHKSDWPPDLAAAVRWNEITPDVLKNPSKPATGYTYVKPAASAVQGDQAARTIVLYESDSTGGRDVGFADGHVEWMNEQQFQAQLKAQQAGGK